MWCAQHLPLVTTIPPLQLALKTVNPARSAYASFLFSQSFFHSYDDGQRAGDTEEEEAEEDTIKCKITIKVRSTKRLFSLSLMYQCLLLCVSARLSSPAHFSLPPSCIPTASLSVAHYSLCSLPPSLPQSCLSVFRALTTLERTVDHCRVKLDLKLSKLVFIFHCRHGTQWGGEIGIRCWGKG